MQSPCTVGDSVCLFVCLFVHASVIGQRGGGITAYRRFLCTFSQLLQCTCTVSRANNCSIEWHEPGKTSLASARPSSVIS